MNLSNETIMRVFWIVLATLAFATYSLILLHLGGWMAVDRAKLAAAQIVQQTPRRANPAEWKPPFDCTTKQGREELSRMCRAQVRMTAVGK